MHLSLTDQLILLLSSSTPPSKHTTKGLWFLTSLLILPRVVQNLFSVSCLLSVQYLLNLYQNLKKWRKNPQWSFSCCLAVLLPLKDLQGDVIGFAATNSFHSQVQKEEFVVPTILAAVKSSGAIDVTLEKGERGNDSTVDAHGFCEAEYRIKRCHQETQTELLSFSFADIVVNEQIGEARLNNCECRAWISNINIYQ